MAGYYEPKIGQVWADNDIRMKGRTLEVIAIEPKEILDNHRVHLKVVSDTKEAVRSQIGRVVKIKARRMKPESTGYLLVKDENGKEI